MICIAVIILCCIIGYVTASNGEWGPFALCVVIAIGALIMSDNDLFRAQNNWVDHWAHPERRQKKEAPVKRETEKEKLARWQREDNERKQDSVVRVSGIKTDGAIEKTASTTQACRVCGGVMREKNRIRYSSGTVYVTYKCEKCGHETPVKVA